MSADYQAALNRERDARKAMDTARALAESAVGPLSYERHWREFEYAQAAWIEAMDAREAVAIALGRAN
jgi:hypothetical protein